MENIPGINWHSESVSGYPSKNAAITKVIVFIDAALGIGERKNSLFTTQNSPVKVQWPMTI